MKKKSPVQKKFGEEEYALKVLEEGKGQGMTDEKRKYKEKI